MTDPRELLSLAQRCLRLARNQTNADLARKLRDLAQDYTKRAAEPELQQNYSEKGNPSLRTNLDS